MSLKHKETDSMTIIMIIMDTGDSEVDSNAGDSIIVQCRMKYLNRLIIVLKKLELNWNNFDNQDDIKTIIDDNWSRK